MDKGRNRFGLVSRALVREKVRTGLDWKGYDGKGKDMKGATYLMAHWREHSLLGGNNGLDGPETRSRVW